MFSSWLWVGKWVIFTHLQNGRVCCYTVNPCSPGRESEKPCLPVLKTKKFSNKEQPLACLAVWSSVYPSTQSLSFSLSMASLSFLIFSNQILIFSGISRVLMQQLPLIAELMEGAGQVSGLWPRFD